MKMRVRVKDSNSSSGGLGLFSVLGIVFVMLKLCGVIHWSWWWVTAPFWGGLALALVVVGVIAILAAVFA